MSLLQRHIDSRGRVHWLPVPHKSAAELNRELELEWARLGAEAKAQAQAQQNAEDVALEVTAIDLYTQLQKAIGGLTTQQSWCDLDDQVTALVDAKGLSGRHGKDLHDRLLRAAKARGWVRD